MIVAICCEICGDETPPDRVLSACLLECPGLGRTLLGFRVEASACSVSVSLLKLSVPVLPCAKGDDRVVEDRMR